jgi:hypothetical protein
MGRSSARPTTGQGIAQDSCDTRFGFVKAASAGVGAVAALAIHPASACRRAHPPAMAVRGGAYPQD